MTIGPFDGRPAAWFHGVSVGEVHLLVTLVAAFRARHPGWRVVVSSTTDAGLKEAARLGPDVVAFPLDFSWACRAALDHVRPRVVVLAESELWPNFLAACARLGVPVVVANARLSPRSFARLLHFGRVARPLLIRPVAAFAAQDAEVAARLAALGARRVEVTGSVKYDGAAEVDSPKSRALAAELGLGVAGGPLVLVAGSTHAPEESLLLAAFAELRGRFPGLVLILVPRHPDRFGEVATLLAERGLAWVRRTALPTPGPAGGRPAVVLLDTVGELGAAWGLADAGFVGGSLDGRRGGQSMIEPAGYGVACVFGPHVWNFKDAARRLVDAGGAVQIADAAGLVEALAGLLGDPARRAGVASAARDLVRAQQGATRRTLDVIDSVLASA